MMGQMNMEMLGRIIFLSNFTKPEIGVIEDYKRVLINLIFNNVHCVCEGLWKGETFDSHSTSSRSNLSENPWINFNTC